MRNQIAIKRILGFWVLLLLTTLRPLYAVVSASRLAISVSKEAPFTTDLPPFGAAKHFKVPHHATDLTGGLAIGAADQLYSERPDINTVEAKDHAGELPGAWQAQKQGHLEAVAEILEMYPDRHIYFLARDGELLYDYAKTKLAHEPDQLERVHLLNVSRSNMSDPHVLKYLAQEGITLENLQNGMKVLFVDTGFSGTIPKTLSDRIFKSIAPSERDALQARLQTHLLASSNSTHPSTRVFLESVHPKADEMHPGQAHGSILSYEYMPRVTHRAQTFQVQEGRWQPSGNPDGGEDGKVDPALGRKFMEDLKHYALSDEAQKRWNQQRAFWRQMRQCLDSEKLEADKKIEIETELKTLLASNEELKKHMVRDVLELIARNEPSKTHLLPNLSSLGLKEIGAFKNEGLKSKVIEKHPEWADILNNPATEIPKLVYGTDTQIETLRQIADKIDDDEIKMLIAQSLMFPPMDNPTVHPMDAHHQQAALQTFKAILAKDNWGSQGGAIGSHLLAKVFNRRDHSHPEFIEAALKSKDSEMRRAAALGLGYYNGHGLSSLFEKALSDESGDVRKTAISSLRYRQPQDPKTLEMLVNLLQDANLKVRKEAAALIRTLYPQVHQPISADLHSEEMTELLQIRPIIPIPKDDLRAVHVPQKFKDLGEMHQIGGLIWSGVAPLKKKQQAAVQYCADLGDGARLPTADEYRSLSRAMGSRDPEREVLRGYSSGQLPGIHGGFFWSASVDPDRDTKAFFLDGSYGYVGVGLRYLFKSVRCVK